MTTSHKDAYFAGLIDGEGNIGSYARKKCNKKRPQVKVNMTCKITIQALASHFGGSVRVQKTPPQHKPQWVWMAEWRKAVGVLERIRPYLITKAAAADEILKDR